MKLSKFNLWVPDYPTKGEHLLFNSRTQGLIKINQEFRDALFASEKTGIINKEIENSLTALKANGIIIEDEQEEAAKLDDFFKQLKYESNGLAFEATILTTYNCNFRCVYCFEESVKENKFLSPQTSDLIASWLIKRAEKRNIKRILLVYYGGEPLLNIPPIYNISYKMQKWAQTKGVEFGFMIITNGSILSLELVNKLLPLGLKEIRVTLDGDRATHNQKRPLLDGSGTFDLIIDNIKLVIDKVNIAVAGNFDRESFPGVIRLLDYLKERNLLYRLSRIDFAPIVPRLGPKDNPKAIELAECASHVGKDGLFEETVRLKKELMRRGIKVRTGLSVNACPLFMQDAGVTIDPDGIIYKCNSLLGYSEFAIGDVRQEEFNHKFNEFMNIDAWKKCPAECPYVPMCQGGCRFFSYLENNNFSDLSCKKEYLDRITPELIKLEYEKLTTARE
ncbi:MAG: SPASM domain-containing protein [Candidatus Omnitrophica bacterium]|nr:SPASM domain-containing protein [Candidatus Omnitrophota bacterium]